MDLKEGSVMNLESTVSYGKNLRISYPNESIHTVKDVPYIIKDYRHLFHYDNGVWIHNENKNIWCNYNRCSQSFSKWLDEKYCGADSRISQRTIIKGDFKKGDKITGRYGSKSVIPELSKSHPEYQERFGGPDVMTIDEYRHARRISFNTLKEYRILPKANCYLANAYNWCFNEESKLGLPHLTLKLNVDIYETMVSKEVESEFKKIYEMMSIIVNNVKNDNHIKKYKNEINIMIQNNAKVFEIIDKDFVNYIINK